MLQDRAGDTNLIHAVKGGHRGVVETLLKKYADVDVTGKDRKTALYMAVEKSNVPVVKMLLGANPDLEMATKVSFRTFSKKFFNFNFIGWRYTPLKSCKIEKCRNSSVVVG